MDFLVFKDIVFDLINECDRFDLKDLTVHDAENKMIAVFEDGTQAEIAFRVIQNTASNEKRD